jgi:tRNA-dihydrouridine synthase B
MATYHPGDGRQRSQQAQQRRVPVQPQGLQRPDRPQQRKPFGQASYIAGIESVRRNSQHDARFERKTAKNGQFYFSLTASNDQAVCRSDVSREFCNRVKISRLTSLLQEIADSACAAGRIRAMQIGRYRIDPPVILAPMAGVTDKPFRQLCKRLGAGMAMSEMTTSDPRFWNTEKSLRRMDHAGEPDPVGVQIAGTDPAVMADAARYNVDHGAQIIDINMGCPAKKVCKVWAGSALMQDEALVARIMSAVVAAVDVPVTLKIRTGWDATHRNAPAIARIAEDAGIAALAVHGRTRDQQYTGSAEYDTIARIKSQLSIPVIANGDIDSPQRAAFVLRHTGADAVMVGRAAQGHPWIFREIAHFLTTGERLPPPSLHEVRDVLLGHLQDLHAFYGELSGVRIARKHLGWYAKGHPDNAGFRAVVNRAEGARAQIDLTRDYFDSLAAGVAPELPLAA